jgi:predicted transcriptional regulator
VRGKSVTIGIRVDEGLRDELERLATADRRTLSQFCALILRDFADGRLIRADAAERPTK